MAAKFQQHCNQFRTDDIDKANFQFQPGGIDKGLKLSVPNDKLAVFWDNYYEFKVKHGVQSHLLERPNKQYNMLKIDLDLKHDFNFLSGKEKYGKLLFVLLLLLNLFFCNCINLS